MQLAHPKVAQPKLMKGHSKFAKTTELVEPHYQIVLCHIQDTGWVGVCESAEIKSVYSREQETSSGWGYCVNCLEACLA